MKIGLISYNKTRVIDHMNLCRKIKVAKQKLAIGTFYTKTNRK